MEKPNNLRLLRKEHKLTQIQVQMKFAIDQSDYSRMERGLRYPTMEQAIAFADFYGTSIDYIVGRTDVPEVNHSKNKERD